MSAPHPDHHPAERYAELAEETREWLEKLRPEDLRKMDDATEVYGNARIIIRFGKWVGGTILAAIILGATAGDSVLKLIHMIRGVKP